ncbi:hypothetical protein [Streptomyces yaizuensis]|uniref:Uncharacterized protein n=1 Tax=Streptomyces yaizuensis TaxID=2989713 RepID=A0ABQ5NSV4_9ACTN|nr:hypothetical protein [Streptomyces sp. YSPA8]GLF93337.1 hypothetical protein SYYSPA8_03590 [Streptomyces sp. YSPA8]
MRPQRAGGPPDALRAGVPGGAPDALRAELPEGLPVGTCDGPLDDLLARAHGALGIAVYDTLMARGGPPEPRDPDRALGLLLAAAHRGTLAAVTARTDRQRREEPGGRRDPDTGPGGGILMDRPPAVRLKYRAQALGIARAHRPHDLLGSTGRARAAVHRLVGELEEERLPDGVRASLARAAEELGRVLALPPGRRPPPALTGYAYLETARARLAERAARLTGRAGSALALLESELLPRLEDPEISWPGVLEVALDLADELDLVHRAAAALLRAVSEAEEAGNDFRGADLRTAALDGVPLEGIRWDADTLWPPDWESRVRRASLTEGEAPGVLVVGPEPQDTTVPADR